MSRIGNRVLRIPDGVQLKVEAERILVSNAKGNSLSIAYNGRLVKPSVSDGEFRTKKANDSRHARAQYGTINALVNNALKGMVEPFTRTLEIVGVGYKATMEGKKLRLQLGYSHPILLEIPQQVTVKLVSSLEIELSSFDKEALGSFASQIRELRPPEPYKGKGIKYRGETIVRKVGKTSEGSKK